MASVTGEWRQIDTGVMVWMPTANDGTQEPISRLSMHTDEAQDCFESNSDRRERHLVLPSIVGVFEHSEQKERINSKFGALSSTLTADSWEGVPALSASPILTPSTISTGSYSSAPNPYDQLRLFASLSSDKPTAPTVSPPTSPSHASPNYASLDFDSSDYDSSRTDFLLTRTPCPVRGKLGPSPHEQSRSHFSRTTRAQSVCRILNFGVQKDKVIKRTPPRPMKMVLPEYSASHRWKAHEREFLCVVWRWYRRDPISFAKIFNAAFKLTLSTRKVCAQFESHIRLYGGRAFPMYNDVFLIPFEDPNGRYSDLRNFIEGTARDLNVELHRLEEEQTSPAGKAAKAKSRLTRKYYRALVKNAYQRQKSQATKTLVKQRPPLRSQPRENQYLGGISLRVRDSWDEELLTDVEDYSMPAVSSVGPSLRPFLLRPYSTPCIAFRCWDQNSRTVFTEDGGFVSEAHTLWRGHYLKPFIFEGEGKQALLFLANLHLCMQGGSSSSFVSISTSLLQVLVKASTMVEPRIAVIALDHPALCEPNKTLEAAEILKLLKKDGQAWWARYRGHAERLVWANLPRASILYYFSLAHLQELSNSNPVCESLLGLDEFQPGRRTLSVSARLREKNTVLSTSTARAMGSIARTFGFAMAGVKLVHIQDFIARLCDGWQITDGSVSDHIKSVAANAFAVTLGSVTHPLKDVMCAFIDGFQQGTDTIAYYSKRRSGTGRMRST